ncbi:DUF3592 domain-containing protein [Streptomyces sp. NPDC050610]|uniref:DUF3592 domain-containing protein n=1 Tax=Streptomyces sp. NPDC050610 TaxID=3157097 RepID=UPI00342777E7
MYGFVTAVTVGGLLIPFGVYPLLVDRRLRSNGVTVKAQCIRGSWSEDRVRETFRFRTLAGRAHSYRSPLRDGRIASDGETVDIVYDPRKPRRARTVRELESPERFFLWGGLALVVILQLGFLGFAIF